MVSFSSSTLLPLLALVGVAAAAERRCTPEHPKVTINGDGYDLLDVATSSECAQACLADTKCVAYEHVDALCIRYSSVGAEALNPNESNTFVSARCMKTADLRLLLTPHENADYADLDVTSASAATPTECGHTCQDTPGCFAYSWTMYNGGSCWMKAGKPDGVTTGDGSVVSGLVYSCQKPTFDSDAVGTDLARVLRPNWYDCCDVCRRTAGCAGFSWSNYNGGTCWLKTGVTGFSTNAGVVAAVM